ncbi:MAG TPA: helix-turn-helix transcriptional regulator [Ferruginibacter sp.]|nr:helix-turn-helix transcriptional regulator [Ferruginibacter sp.]
MNQIELGKRIREARQNVGISQEKLSDITGLNPRTIQRIETGETDPRGDSITRIAAALGISVEQLAPGVNSALPVEPGLFKQNNGMVMLLIIAQSAFLWAPVLGLIFPGIIWLFFKEKVKGLDKLGKRVLKLQLIWYILFAAVFASLYRSSIDFETKEIIRQVLYCLNLVMIVAEGLWVGLSNRGPSVKETGLEKGGVEV